MQGSSEPGRARVPDRARRVGSEGPPTPHGHDHPLPAPAGPSGARFAVMTWVGSSACWVPV